MRLALDFVIIAIFLIVLTFVLDKKYIFKNMSLRNIRRSYRVGWVARIVSHFVPSVNSRKYRWFKKTVEEAFLDYSIEQLYFYKLSLAVIVAIFAILIQFTNFRIGNVEIIKETDRVVENLVSYDVAESIRLEKVLKMADVERIRRSNRTDALEYLKNELIVMSGVTAIPDNVVLIIYDGINKLNRGFNVMFIGVPLLSLVVGYWVPEVCLLLYIKVRKKQFENEVRNLEMLTLIIGGVPTVTARDIIEELLENSKVFKPLLREFYREYIIDTDSAYRMILDKPISNDFSKIIHTIRQIETSDKNAALKALELSRESRAQTRKLISEEWVKRKDFIALMMYIVVAVMLLRIVVTPWIRELEIINQINSLF